jgi:hypothetical protein
VSSPGTASASDALVKVREGNSLVADVGALILWVVCCAVSRRVRGVKPSCWEGGAAVYVELALFGFAAGQASVECVFASTMYGCGYGNWYASARGEI